MKYFLLTLFNILRQPLQTFKQAFACGSTTEWTREIAQLTYKARKITALTSGEHTMNDLASDEGPISQ